MKRILIVEDEADLRAMIREMLEGQYEILEAGNGREALQQALQETPDLILLDLSIPEIHGTEVCRRIRENPSARKIPIIMVTAHGEVESRVNGLDVGADDYLVKPFHTSELQARIRARLRKPERGDRTLPWLELGNIRLNRETREATVGERPIHLTRLECDLLQYFADRINCVVERRQLLGDLWPDSVVTERTVDTHMANLRRKIAGFNHRIETVHGSGYILKSEQNQ